MLKCCPRSWLTHLCLCSCHIPRSCCCSANVPPQALVTGAGFSWSWRYSKQRPDGSQQPSLIFDWGVWVPGERGVVEGLGLAW